MEGIVSNAACRDVACDAFIQPRRGRQVRRQIVELVCRLMHHPVIRVDRVCGVVLIAIRPAIEGLGPAVNAVATSELPAVLEQLDPQPGKAQSWVARANRNSTVKRVWRCHPANRMGHTKHARALTMPPTTSCLLCHNPVVQPCRAPIRLSFDAGVALPDAPDFLFIGRLSVVGQERDDQGAGRPAELHPFLGWPTTQDRI
jgi:hypothetical protein